MSPATQSQPPLLAYCTDSAGMHPSHTLPQKLRAIASAGFAAAEIAFPDLEAHAAAAVPGYHKIDNAGRGDVETLVGVAREVRGLCESLGLSVLAVHPFSQFEGYTETGKREEGFARAQTWFRVLKALGCQMLQVGSSNDPDISSDPDIMAKDLRQLADEAAAQDPPIRIAYELWAWGTHVNTWEGAWDVCKRVDRPNFGLCLDTFQIAARAYADPCSPNGLLQSASPQVTLSTSLKQLVAELTPHAHKIFYLQISDGAGPHNALFSSTTLKEEAREQRVDPRYVWSNKWRPVPFMDEIVEGSGCGESSFGGYLPVVDVVEAVVRTGWRGPWSYEVFYEADMGKADADVPTRWTNAAMESQKRILKELERRGMS
ncbi:xylose isomerase-like protein [Neolentinus lepideus HHB14362 ss-1]|uniref:Xylose isomerase-like protein n=1 Tax=Neolentinus lepideus HHB14362 ss-1 TaxID=1314782 RepID=A0A165MRE3_9AGAM|nr:xylose isomerase-like protein [Neolentinus lepideus HHB14362 ss-1]